MITLLAAVLALAQDPPKLTKESLAKAATVEIEVVQHSGEKSEGSVLTIRGDGTVARSWSAWYPIVEREKRVAETLRQPLSKETLASIVRCCIDSGALEMPASAGLSSGRMRHLVRITAAGCAPFEAEIVPLDQDTPPLKLVNAIRDAVDALEKKIEEYDAAFLTSDKIAGLIKEDPTSLVLELHDIQGLWGGASLRAGGDGRVQGISVTPPKQGETGMHEHRFEGTLATDRIRGILAACADRKTFDIRPKRATGVPDEGRPTLVLAATVKGVVYRRRVSLWNGEARETPEFKVVREALERIAAEFATGK